MNAIFICVFCQEKYVDMLFLLLESIYLHCILEPNMEILIYTTSSFRDKIQSSHWMSKYIRFEINDTYDTIEAACCARLDIFDLPSISRYEKILYLDTDIIVKGDVSQSIFDLVKDDILYVVREGSIDLGTMEDSFWGKGLFGNEIELYQDKSAFSSGIILFRNSSAIQTLFEYIRNDIQERKSLMNHVYDQPYIIYNAFKYRMYDNTALEAYSINARFINDTFEVENDKIICHFCGSVGAFDWKYNAMTTFLQALKDVRINNNLNKTKQLIEEHLLPIVHFYKEPLEGNIFMLHETTTFTDVYLNKAKNISNVVLPFHIKNVMEIGFNAGFSTLLMLVSNPYVCITCFDLGEHTYTRPCFKKLESLFPGRLSILYGNSVETVSVYAETNANKVFDVIHIDGCHMTEIAEGDIQNSFCLTRQGSIIIMDDYDFPNLHDLWDKYVTQYELKPLQMCLCSTVYHDIKYVHKASRNN